LLTSDGKAALIRGHKFGYGDKFDCNQRATKNWIAVYDPATKAEKTIFDRPLDFGFDLNFCIYQQIRLSPDDALLYLISPISAVSGSMAIINRASGSIAYVHGVNQVHVIESGPHAGELIYDRRTLRGSVSYPLIHARPDGKPIVEISDELFPTKNYDKAPRLRAYLRKIDATITVDGQKLP
jgi:hypothetical protein